MFEEDKYFYGPPYLANDSSMSGCGFHEVPDDTPFENNYNSMCPSEPRSTMRGGCYPSSFRLFLLGPIFTVFSIMRTHDDNPPEVYDDKRD